VALHRQLILLIHRHPETVTGARRLVNGVENETKDTTTYP
jgi:hypothetical protein